MIALKIFPIVHVILILCTDLIYSYPNYYYSNAKRYRQLSRYDPYDSYYSRNQRYQTAPYDAQQQQQYLSQIYPEDYYTFTQQDAYPFYYYLLPRTSKFDQYYQPYYYQELPRMYYNYLNQEDPEKLLQDIEREQREKAQPIGHEIRYENDDVDNADVIDDDTNAAFFNNLMLQQMYHKKDKLVPPYDPYLMSDEYDLIEQNVNYPEKLTMDVPYDRPVHVEDEDVNELKALPKKQRTNKQQRKQRKQRKQQNEKKSNNNDDKSDMAFSDRKPTLENPGRNTRGQKEEVMLRPATPIRHPFSDTILERLNQQNEELQQQQRKRSPSVYEKIKQMLEMEKNEQNFQSHVDNVNVKPTMKKRIVTNEDSLIRQLTVLKKSQ
ncbi:hypothetical protein ABEB36_013931 [Hypothenemus hampei]|uniref:Uncharacterized protein n=1 Tax=Hypothenemus hampei TaxID=57062 RepID=A0ABD1E5Y8_HYPHA